MIVVDRGQIGGSVHQAARAAEHLLDQMGPADRVAVFSLPSGPRLDFSADRAAVEKTLGTIGPVQDSVVTEFNLSYTEALALATGRVRAEESPVRCGSARPSWDERDPAARAPKPVAAPRLEAEARRIVDNQDDGVRERLNALEALCRALAEVPGPKQMVLVSGGFTSALTGRFPVGPQLRRIANAAAAASVNLYTVYLPAASRRWTRRRRGRTRRRKRTAICCRPGSDS